MGRKKIAFVNTNMHIGGIPKASIPFLEQLQKIYDVTLFLTDGEGELIGSVPKDVKIVILPNENYKSQILDALKKLKFCKTIKSLISYFSAKNWLQKLEAKIKLSEKINESFDCAICFFGMNAKCLFTTLDIIDAKKKLAFIHGDHPFKENELATAEKIYQRFDRIFCGSKANVKSFLSDFPNCNDLTDYFYCIINEKEVLSESQKECDLVKKDGLLNILTVGRLSPEKGQDMIPQIAEILKNKGFDFIWTLVGDGELMNQIKTESINRGVFDKLSFAGSKKNPYPYFASCDIFVQPSYTEGYSIVTREAAMLGKPIVATNVGGQPEGFVNGVDILLVEPNVEEISNALIRLLSDDEMRNYLSQNIARGDYTNIGEMQKIVSFIN